MRASGTAGHRFTAARREEERVTPLELFFDLVFVLALTQCTALMVADPNWDGRARGLLVLDAGIIAAAAVGIVMEGADGQPSQSHRARQQIF